MSYPFFLYILIRKYPDIQTGESYLKRFNKSIALIMFLFLTGCSTYNVTEFSSKKDFYEYLNKSIKDKDVEICIKNDSTLSSKSNVIIQNDTLIFPDKKVEKTDKLLLLSEIKTIEYTGNNFERPSAFLELKSGQKIEAENIGTMKDSMRFTDIKHLSLKYSIPAAEIENVSYKSRLTSTLYGFLIGAVSGGAIGGFTQIIPANQNHPSFTPPYQEGEYSRLSAIVTGTVSGAVIGAITGWLLGYDYIYQF